MYRKLSCCLLAIFLVLAGCNSSSTPENQAAPGGDAAKGQTTIKVELANGLFAFDRLLAASHLWAADAQPVSLQSPMRKENTHDGKSCVWGLLVASPTKKQIKVFYWSGIGVPDAPSPGISEGQPSAYDAKNPNTQVFDVKKLKVDSNQALATADAHGGSDEWKKAGTMAQYFLKLDAKTKSPEWQVIYGASDDKPSLTVHVDASSGAVNAGK